MAIRNSRAKLDVLLTIGAEIGGKTEMKMAPLLNYWQVLSLIQTVSHKDKDISTA